MLKKLIGLVLILFWSAVYGIMYLQIQAKPQQNQVSPTPSPTSKPTPTVELDAVTEILTETQKNLVQNVVKNYITNASILHTQYNSQQDKYEVITALPKGDSIEIYELYISPAGKVTQTKLLYPLLQNN
ncbi:hypothetical protein HGA91_00370 [candidate division WWE3 bacterium]|nr:hypothetical protein [candidate division WWE3 bacterium]